MKFLAKPALIAICLILGWSVVTAVMLTRITERTQSDLRKQAQSWASGFRSSFLIHPDGYRYIFRTMSREYFRDLEKRQPYFRGVTLTWMHPDSKKEIVLYHTHHDARDPSRTRIGQPFSMRRLESLVSIPIRGDAEEDSQRIHGYLHFQVDPREVRAPTVTFLLGAINVLLIVLIMLYWLSRVSQRYEASQLELEEKKKELIQMEQLALAGRLSAGLLHDLKKPIIHIREECIDSGEAEAFKDIREQSELFLAMLRDSGLEGFARSRKGEPEHCDIVDLVERALRLVQYEKNDVNTHLQADDSTPLVLALPTRLIQVFSNLILNAYQAMKGHGDLWIKIYGESVERQDRAIVVFEDTGPGIVSENSERIFEPFFTTGESGSGMGLYITRTIIEELGGEIRSEPRPGKGARFVVVLPESPDDTTGSRSP